MITVGFGKTVYCRCSSGGHLDGIGVYTKNLEEHLQSLGINIYPVVFGRKGLELCHNHYHYTNRSFSLSILTSALSGRSFQGVEMLKQLQLFHAPDHLIPKLSIPVIASLMDPIPLIRPDWIKSRFRFIKKYLFMKSVHWANHFITISNFVADDIAEHFHIPRKSITPIYLAVDDKYFRVANADLKNSVLQRYNMRNGFFLFIGTLQPRKNISRLVQAFKQLPLELQHEFPLVVIGRNGWNADDDIAEMKRLEEQGIGRWLDFVSDEDKSVLLQCAGAFVFPSLYEGFGLPILESFASETPVITSNSTSLPEIAGGAAMLVDPYSPDSIADAMLQIVSNQEMALSLIEKGKKRAREFSWTETARKTAEVYKSLI